MQIRLFSCTALDMPHKLNGNTFQLKDCDLAAEILLLDHQFTVASLVSIADNERINDKSAAHSSDCSAANEQHQEVPHRVHVRLGLGRALLGDMRAR